MESRRSDSELIAWLALVLFIAGLLLPFAAYPVLVGLVLIPHQAAAQLSAAIASVCELLALILGFVGRRYLPGKVAGIGSGVIVGLTLFALVRLFYR